jgi:hypothetical protein
VSGSVGLIGQLSAAGGTRGSIRIDGRPTVLAAHLWRSDYRPGSGRLQADDFADWLVDLPDRLASIIVVYARQGASVSAERTAST